MTKALKAAVLVLSFLGIADAWYLTQSALTGTPLTCNIDGLDGCNIVAQSAYSHLFGQPLALYGVFFYGLVFVVAALAFTGIHKRIPEALFALAALGLAASVVFIGIQEFLIKALCMYCLASAFIALLIFIAAWAIWSDARRERGGVPPVVVPWDEGSPSARVLS